MTEVRGWSLETQADRAAEARRFLSWLGEHGSRQGLLSITPPVIDAYMMQRAKSLRRTTLKTRAVELRSFLRYLHATRRLLLEPSTAIIIPRLYTFESIPSTLRAEDIKALLEATGKDRSARRILRAWDSAELPGLCRAPLRHAEFADADGDCGITARAVKGL
jgi:site-specific recombinase XerD